MAEEENQQEKTEEPSEKKLLDARKKGQIANSREVTTFFMLLISALIIFISFPSFMKDLLLTSMSFIEKPHEYSFSPHDVRAFTSQTILDVIGILFVPFLLFLIAPLIGGFLQTGFLFTLEPIKPKLSKISLKSGFKKIFSARSLMEFLKGIIKIIIVATISVIILYPEVSKLPNLIFRESKYILSYIHILVLKLFAGVVAIMAIVAALDYLYQRYDHRKKLRMTKQEVKDEYKQTEGDPTVKSRIRQIRAERAKQRISSSVPQADVIITNPTHYAIALKYDLENMNAPTVIAKGQDNIALNIRSIAEENDIIIVENPPLARALFTVDIDQEIPFDYYQTVAEIISYVWRIKGKK